MSSNCSKLSQPLSIAMDLEEEEAVRLQSSLSSAASAAGAWLPDAV